MGRFLFTTFGSYGDVHPYLAVSAELVRLGHTVRIATSECYRVKVISAGFEFAAIRPDISLEDQEMMRYLFHQRKGTERVVREIARVVDETYEDTVAHAGDVDVMVTHPIAFGAVVAAQKLRMPWVSTVLAPASFLSAYDPPVPAPAPWVVKVRALGPWAMRLLWRAALHDVARWAGPVFELRRRVGLPRGGNPLFEGGNSPDLVLGLFSSVFAEPQPDWPRQAATTGFPFLPTRDAGLTPEVERFLKDGPAPIVFTLGSSAVGAAGDFYQASLEAVRRLRVRALFLTGPHPQGLPDRLPTGVLAHAYAPHGLVFPRASLIVQQGGIGTVAEALRSGRPVLTVPFAHDQFDNGARLERLGVGRMVPRAKYKVKTAEAALARLLSDGSYAKAASEVGERIRVENGALTAAQALERYAREHRQ